MVLIATFQLGVSRLMAVAERGGGWGIVGSLILAGFMFAVIFTAIYDGPRVLARLFRRESA